MTIKSKDTAAVALLGHGVVGSGVVEILENNASGIKKKAGKSVYVKHILDLREFPELAYHDKFTKDFSTIVEDPEVEVVVEAMGGIEPAYSFVKESLCAGKSVVTSNKELVAAKGAELLALAAENHVNFLFEASVGGGIPIIRPLHQCLAANTIGEIAGILNGTTNFILTKMITEDMSFDDALALAQELGYAEADPAADVEGDDAARKICILASLAFGEHVYLENVHVEGITNITAVDVEYAAAADCVIKLIGQANGKPQTAEEGKYHVMVSPALLSKESQLAGINDVFNGILVRGDATGDVVFYGKGAGKLPTASAVIGDVVDCVKSDDTIVSLAWKDSSENNVADYLAQPVQLYVRATGSLLEMNSHMGDITMLERPGQPEEEYAFITRLEKEGALREKLAAMETAGCQILQTIRLLDY